MNGVIILYSTDNPPQTIPVLVSSAARTESSPSRAYTAVVATLEWFSTLPLFQRETIPRTRHLRAHRATQVMQPNILKPCRLADAAPWVADVYKMLARQDIRTSLDSWYLIENG